MFKRTNTTRIQISELAAQQREQLINLAARHERVTDLLWSPGYSVYLTAWCKKYLALKLLDHRYPRCARFDEESEYVCMQYYWYNHHVDFLINIPPPPKLFQFLDAVNYLRVIGIITH